MRGLARLFLEKTTAEWLLGLEKADVPCGPVHNYETLLRDPGNRRKRKLLDLRTSQRRPGAHRDPGARFSETPMKMWRVPPKLGEHTDEILRSRPESNVVQVDELRAAKVIM